MRLNLPLFQHALTLLGWFYPIKPTQTRDLKTTPNEEDSPDEIGVSWVLKITPNEEDRPEDKIGHDSSDIVAITTLDISGLILDVG